ncbi:MAG: RagB/SusD family nutrient uptake outer membrane protein [Muribaculaceae bacterium]|nr:RagB/SusD family nutrient uptake outer membrane protein [Muribaculaceae bacterium]
MKKTLYTAILAVAALSTVSCSDFLDKKSTAYDSDGFYESEAGLDEGVTAIYRTLVYDENWAVPQIMVQDVYSPYACQFTENNTISAGPGLTPDQSYVKSYWNGHYAIVGRANNVITGAKVDFAGLMDPNSGLSDKYRRRLAEAYALRGYAYYNLVQAFGNIPFLKQAATPDDYTCFATPKEEIAAYIIDQLQELVDAEILPWAPEQLGRMGNGAVAELLARWALFAGSHDFDGKGQTYFDISAKAAKKVMDHHGLAQNFPDLFTHAGQAKADVQKEILWVYPYCMGSVNHTSKIRLGHTSRSAGGSSVRFPSSFTHMIFECTDGKRIDESPLYDPSKPYLNRDPRMAHTILMHGQEFWWNNGENAIRLNVYDKNHDKYPNPRRKGQWYKTDNIDVTGTDYSCARSGLGALWMKYNEDMTESFSDCTIDLIVMRGAEAYLTYAEAMIEQNKLEQSVYDAINDVRERAGMPKFDASREGDQDKMRQIVRRERKAELAMEGVLVTDFRRWKIGDLLNALPIHGQPVATLEDGTKFQYDGLAGKTYIPNFDREFLPNFKSTPRHDLNDIPDFTECSQYYTTRDSKRFWNDRFMWWPIPRAELDKNPNLSNPEGY